MCFFFLESEWMKERGKKIEELKERGKEGNFLINQWPTFALIYLSMYLSIYLSINISIYLSIYLSSRFLFLMFYLSIYLSSRFLFLMYDFSKRKVRIHHKTDAVTYCFACLRCDLLFLILFRFHMNCGGKAVFIGEVIRKEEGR